MQMFPAVSRILSVPIANCVHHAGFRYGRGEVNPYENYVVGLSRDVPVQRLRNDFEELIRHYRPRDLAEAVGVVTRESIPAWLMPWKSWRKLRQPGAWRESPDDILDILTYFCPQGIRRSRFNEEYGWLESAWKNITQTGYQPEQYSYITVFELRGDSESRFIVLDGNHRLSALAATGVKTVEVKQPAWSRASRRQARFWPLVLTGHIRLDDAHRIFDAYFAGNTSPFRSDFPADVLEDC